MRKVEDVSVKRFVGWIKSAPQSPKCALVSPEIALEALTYNTDEENENGHKQQRPLSGAWVRELARRLSKGMWRLTSEGIAFDWNGLVQNGQHRLHAVIEAGVAMPLWVFFGQDPALFDKIDGGKKRTAGDIFAIRGEPNSKAAAAITRQVSVYHSRGYRGNSTGFPTVNTPEETFDYYCEVGCDDIQEGVRIYRALTSHRIPKQSVIAGLYVVAHQMTNGEATDFFEKLATGANLGPRSIEKKLRDHLLVAGKDTTPPKIAADVIRAWNAKRAGRRVFSTAPVDTMPELV